MREFIDETSEKEGTNFDRSNMMALQGYQGETVIFGNIIVKTNDKNETEEISFSDSQIIKRFVGEKTITQTITFTDTGYTKELS